MNLSKVNFSSQPTNCSLQKHTPVDPESLLHDNYHFKMMIRELAGPRAERTQPCCSLNPKPHGHFLEFRLQALEFRGSLLQGPSQKVTQPDTNFRSGLKERA